MLLTFDQKLIIDYPSGVRFIDFLIVSLSCRSLKVAKNVGNKTRKKICSAVIRSVQCICHKLIFGT